MQNPASRDEPTQADDPDAAARPTLPMTIPSENVAPECPPAPPLASHAEPQLIAEPGLTVDLASDPREPATVGVVPPSTRGRSLPSIPGYEILGVLGRGGMGVVYKARQIRLNRPCALKMILAGMHSTTEASDRFLAEAEAIAQIQHPNIVQIHHIGEADNLPFFELEFLAGGSLDQRIDGTPWPAKSAARVAEQMACGIAEAHRKGIVHRDLKPSNVLLASDGTPKITDFGLAKAEGRGSSLTKSESILGSPSYMAPEQASGKTKQAGPEVDIYAIGATLYELLTGRPPFAGTTPLETMEQVKTIEPVPPSRLVPKLARDIETICLKCLQKEPGKRYHSAWALAEDLRRYQSDEPILARRIRGVERAWRWCRRNPLVAGLLFGIALALVLGTLVSSYFGLRAQRGEMLALQRANEALANARHAYEQTRRANLEAQHAREAKLLSDRRQYVAEMNLAERAREDGNTQLVERLVAAQVPKQPGDVDLRGFEWYYLQRNCQMDLRTLCGHTDNVMGVAFSPEGRWVASAGEDGTVRLWDAATGRETRAPRGHASNVFCVAFSRDGRRIASGGMDQTVALEDAESGQVIQTLRGHSGFVMAVDFSPDGRRIASASLDGTAKLWDATTGKEVLTLRGHHDQLWGVAFSPDGRRIATSSADSSVKLWHAGTGAEVKSLRGHSARVWGISFSPDGRHLASASDDRTVKVWDLATGKELLTLYGHANQVYGLAFSPDGLHLASASADHTVKLWDLTRSREVETFSGHSAPVLAVAFSPDGRRIASASNDRTVKLWDTTSPHGALSFSGHSAPVVSVAFSPDGRHVASSGYDRCARIWDTTTFQEVATLRGHLGGIVAVVFCPDGLHIVTAGDDGTVKLWDARTGQAKMTYSGHTERIADLALSSDGRRIASASVDRSVRVWDTHGYQTSAVLTLRGHSDRVAGVAISLDGSQIASAGEDHTLKLWDAATGKELRALLGHSAAVTCVRFSADGRHIASGSADHTVKLWDAASGQEVLTLRGHSARVLSVAFSPDGQRILSAGEDANVILWDVVTGQEVLSLRGHKGAVTSAAFRPNCLQIASASADGTVKIWDATPLTPEVRVLREARAVVDSLFARSLSTAEVLSSLRDDPTLSDSVRREALALAGPHGQSMVRQEAERIVNGLYNRAMFRNEVLESLRSNRLLTDAVKEQALALAETLQESPRALNGAAWSFVCAPQAAPQAYRRALRLAEAACRLLPNFGSTLNTLGVAQCRVGRYEEAVATLTRSAELNSDATGEPDPADLAFLAVSHYHLGHKETARAFLDQLRRLASKTEYKNNQEAHDFLGEAEAMELDLAFPANPLAP